MDQPVIHKKAAISWPAIHVKCAGPSRVFLVMMRSDNRHCRRGQQAINFEIKREHAAALPGGA